MVSSTVSRQTQRSIVLQSKSRCESGNAGLIGLSFDNCAARRARANHDDAGKVMARPPTRHGTDGRTAEKAIEEDTLAPQAPATKVKHVISQVAFDSSSNLGNSD